MPKLTDIYVLPHFENLRERVNMICVLSNLLVAGLSHENLILKYNACSTRFSRYVNLSSFLTQIGKVTYSSFVLIGHKFPSPIASFVHRESAVTL